MKIALFGYGKMGKEIEKIALERGHEIILKIKAKEECDFSKVDIESILASQKQRLIMLLVVLRIISL